MIFIAPEIRPVPGLAKNGNNNFSRGLNRIPFKQSDVAEISDLLSSTVHGSLQSGITRAG